jgi:2,3-bisphosphoglycerate-dependent phosphoglycerate mutase
MPVYLIRHGETTLNAARILQPPDTPLSEHGSAQAYALGARLRAQSVDAILSSDMVRAMQTAKAILAERPVADSLALKISPLLQERNLGDYRGQPYEVIGCDLLDFKEAPPGGESLVAFEARVAIAFDQVIALHRLLTVTTNPDPLLLVVSHGLVIRRMIEAHVGLGADQRVPDHLANTSITIFETAPPHAVTLLNSSSHLLELKPNQKAAAFGG